MKGEESKTLQSRCVVFSFLNCRTINVPERSVNILRDATPVLHVTRVDGLHAVLHGAESPVAARLEEVGVVGGVLAPAKSRLDPRHRKTQSPYGLWSSDWPLCIKHPVVLTCSQSEEKKLSKSKSSTVFFFFLELSRRTFGRQAEESSIRLYGIKPTAGVICCHT